MQLLRGMVRAKSSQAREKWEIKTCFSSDYECFNYLWLSWELLNWFRWKISCIILLTSLSEQWKFSMQLPLMFTRCSIKRSPLERPDDGNFSLHIQQICFPCFLLRKTCLLIAKTTKTARKTITKKIKLHASTIPSSYLLFFSFLPHIKQHKTNSFGWSSWRRFSWMLSRATSWGTTG